MKALMNRTKKPVPATATYRQLCKMSRDNVCVGDFSLMVDGADTVYISEQAMGEMPRQRLHISRKTFNKLIRWYTTNRVPAEDKASR